MLTPLFDKISINAWTGDNVAVADQPDIRWALRSEPVEGERTFLAPPVAANLADWTDPRVGFGVVLAETPGLTAEQLASGDDAPEPIRKLIAERRKLAPVAVLRYRPTSSLRFSLLRNYATQKDLDLANSNRGSAVDALPLYLLVYGSPALIPWRLQYALNANSCVSRLTLEGDSLERYVSAVLDNWSGSTTQVQQPVVWSVNHGGGDISGLMRDCIGKPVADKLQNDASIGAKLTFLDSAAAKRTALVTALEENRPSLVVTTSHGMTGPLNDSAAMAANLGVLVDQEHQNCQPGDLLAKWQPDGAVWYAHACCSAGSDQDSNFTGLVPVGSMVDQVLKGIASLGSLVSPLPIALLGSAKPLRCFIGHVEPTFDWTLRRPANGQFLTSHLIKSLYDEIGRGKPVTLAFREYYQALRALFGRHQDAVTLFNQGNPGAANDMTEALLTAKDIRSTVILGDPLVALSAIP